MTHREDKKQRKGEEPSKKPNIIREEEVEKNRTKGSIQ